MRGSTSSPTRGSARLPLAKQQQVEILRALARNAALIVFDEPTASLAAAEVERLHDVVRALRARADGHPRLAFPARGPRPRRHHHGPARRPRRQHRGGRRGDGGKPDRRHARAVRRAHIPAQALPAADAPVVLEAVACGGRRRGASLTARRARSSAWPGSSGPAGSELGRAIYGAAARPAGGRRSPARRWPASRAIAAGRGRAYPRVPQGRRPDAPPAGPRERQPHRARDVQPVRASSPAAASAAGSASPDRVAGTTLLEAPAGLAVRRQPAEAAVRPGAASDARRADRRRANPGRGHRRQAGPLRAARLPRGRRGRPSCSSPTRSRSCSAWRTGCS